ARRANAKSGIRNSGRSFVGKGTLHAGSINCSGDIEVFAARNNARVNVRSAGVKSRAQKGIGSSGNSAAINVVARNGAGAGVPGQSHRVLRGRVGSRTGQTHSENR